MVSDTFPFKKLLSLSPRIENNTFKIKTYRKIFKIDNKKIGLIIFIALSIIPNVLNELQYKKYSIKSKSININLKNLFLIVKSVLVSMLIKVNEYENALVSKGYSGE